jgi:phytoene desaturase
MISKILDAQEIKILEDLGLIDTLQKSLNKLQKKQINKAKFDQELENLFSKKSKQINQKNKLATGVLLKNKEILSSDLVVSNADFAHTYLDLIDKEKRFWNSDLRVKGLTEYSMSLVVIYFAFKKTPQNDLSPNLRHHNIIVGSNNYLQEFKNIFELSELTEKFSQYLHIPTITDKTIAPEGFHTSYTLVCVPNLKKSKQNWLEIQENFVQKVLTYLEKEEFIPNLKARLVHTSWITPEYFQNNLNSFLGNAFGVSPVFKQSAFFRPHNQSEDISNLYLVGANTQPGAGTPSVMMSAKITAAEIAKNYPQTN